MPYAVIRVTDHDRKRLDALSLVLVRPQFADLARAHRGQPVLLYQSVRQKERARESLGYFASAYIDQVWPTADGIRTAIFLKDVQPLRASGFANDFAASDDLEEPSGWHAAVDVREISDDKYAALTRTVPQPAFELISPVQNLVLPRFQTRNERVRDPKFRERVYFAYEGRCAISGVQLLSPDGVCGLEAAHIVPNALSPHHRASAGILLAPTWHWLFDSGSIIIHDDFSWTAVIEDHDTLRINDRRLTLPSNKSDQPEIALLRQKRALFAGRTFRD